MAKRYDVVIVGGGTAGCIVAARLSEDPARSVLLLEAGPDYPSIAATPAGVLDARYVPMRSHAPAFDPDHDWRINVQLGGTRIVIPQARLIGGGSAINGTLALRGARADYREWVAEGNPDWGWEDVLPVFRALENDDAGDDAWHGRSGPYPISRPTEAELAPLQKAFIASALAVGAAPCADFNAPDGEGVGAVTQSRRGGTRVSTAIAYLNPARARANLTVRGYAEAGRVLFDGKRAIGVELTDGTAVEAGEVIVSAGAIASPALLQRSGVGPAALLREHGIRVVAHLPVGDNLGDHCVVPILAEPRPGSWSPDHYSLQAVWRFSTSVQPGTLDAQLTMFSYLNVRTTGEGARGLAGIGGGALENVAGIGCVLNKPRSTGVVRIASPRTEIPPHVALNYLEEEVDRRVMREIVRCGWSVISAEPLAGMLNTPIGIDAATAADDEMLDGTIAEALASGYHFTGTCKMAAPEKAGVVDQEGRVYGVRGLRVIDASVLPTVPAANAMLPTVMAAEKLAATGL
jgi:choline dehydrogenase